MSAMVKLKSWAYVQVAKVQGISSRTAKVQKLSCSRLKSYEVLRRAFCLGILLVFGGCSSLPDNTIQIPSYALTDVSHSALANDVQALADQHLHKSGFYPLEDGLEAMAARLVLIRDAQLSIDLQYYIWHDDLTGKGLHQKLLEAADRGVRVRLLLDDLDTAGKDHYLRLIDAHENVEVRLFNPFAGRDHRLTEFITDTSRINRRSHNKTFTVDNSVTIFGGRNIGDEYFNANLGVGFSDLDFMGVGPIAKEVSESFDLYWNSEWVFALSTFYDNQMPDASLVEEYRNELKTYTDNISQEAYSEALRALKVQDYRSIKEFGLEWEDWTTIYDAPEKISTNEVTENYYMAPTLKRRFDQVSNELIIVSPYFVPGSTFTQYLVDLVARGVRVVVITNSLASNDVGLVHAGYMRYRKALLTGGVELYEYKPLDNPALESKKTSWSGSSRASLHGKYFGMDQQTLFVGSFNLDNRSTSLNTEFGVFIESELFAKTLAVNVEANALIKAYKVELNDNGGLQWTTLDKNSVIQVYKKEPETSYWKRIETGFLSWFVPESQL